jgi:hypothetical protein
MPLLGYERWENFDKAIGRAIESCKTSGIEVSDHFREVTKMMTTGKGASSQGLRAYSFCFAANICVIILAAI